MVSGRLPLLRKCFRTVPSWLQGRQDKGGDGQGVALREWVASARCQRTGDAGHLAQSREALPAPGQDRLRHGGASLIFADSQFVPACRTSNMVSGSRPAAK